MDEINAGIDNFDAMIAALRRTVAHFTQPGLKLSAHNGDFDTTKKDRSGSKIIPTGISPKIAKTEKFQLQVGMLNILKQMQRVIDFVQILRKFVFNLERKSIPFWRLLQGEKALKFFIEYHKFLSSLKTVLTRDTILTIRLAKPGPQYCISCDSCFHVSSFVLRGKDNLID